MTRESMSVRQKRTYDSSSDEYIRTSPMLVVDIAAGCPQENDDFSIKVVTGSNIRYFYGSNIYELSLMDVEGLLENIAASWFYSGDLYAGEV